MIFKRNDSLDQILNPTEAANFLQLSKNTLRCYTSIGKIPSVKRDRRRFYLKSELIGYVLGEHQPATS